MIVNNSLKAFWRRFAAPAQHWQADVAASFIVFLLSLPLSMGIALASGAPASAGLVAAAVGGLVGGLCGGAPFLVSGPATSLAIIVMDVSQRFGWAAVGLVTCLAGCLQIALSRTQVPYYATAISPAILSGMMTSIGAVIVLGQLLVVLGQQPSASFWRNVLDLPPALQHADMHSVWVGGATLGLLLAWPYLPLARLRLPPALLVVGLVSWLAHRLHLQVTPIDLPSPLQLPRLAWQDLPWLPILLAALSLALMATTNALLAVVAVDKLHHAPRAQLPRELLAQGLMNLLSGLLGGLPVTGMLARSTANLEAGARSRLANLWLGGWLLLAMFTLSRWLALVPQVALAGLLIVVGYRLLLGGSPLRELQRHGELSVYLATVVGALGVNLLVGIGLGFGTAVGRLFWQLAKARITVRQQTDGQILMTIQGAVTFLLVPKMMAAFAELPAGRTIDLHIHALLIDHAARQALHTWQRGYESSRAHNLPGQVHIDMRGLSGAPRATHQKLAA